MGGRGLTADRGETENERVVMECSTETMHEKRERVTSGGEGGGRGVDEELRGETKARYCCRPEQKKSVIARLPGPFAARTSRDTHRR